MKIDRGTGAWGGLGGALLWALWFFKRAFSELLLKRRPKFRGWLRRLYRAILVRLVARTKLFDAAYYLEANPDVAHSGCDPIAHYVNHGEIEGRQPMPLFDPIHYRAQCESGGHIVNCLLHYAWVGRARGYSPSAWFDLQYYLAHNQDVAASGVDPVSHYLTYGGVQGRSPCPRFDGLYYLKSNPDVAAARVNPLLHYLQFGRAEKRRPVPPESSQDSEPFSPGMVEQARVPSEQDWSTSTPRPDREGLQLDVVVPVYKGRAETLCCLLSVLRAPCEVSFALVVINDGSPDTELSADLERLAGQGLFMLLTNECNLGFVRTVNRGMQLHAERDIVLLNSDTEVYGNWLDRLAAAAVSDARVGSVTPLSNSATICSYPRFPHDNPYPLELGYSELDRLAAELNAGVRVEAPSGVGFCMYIRRKCLSEVGIFDADTFGRGYGEENDFCQRSLRRGWRNLIAADVFVRHWGSMSFEGEKEQRVRDAMEIVGRRYPGYHQDVARFIASDPLAPARARLDWGRFRRHVRTKNVLLVCHSRGGGTERRVQGDVQRLQQDGSGTFLLRPMIGNMSRVVLTHPLVRNVPNLQGFSFADIAPLEAACRELGITEIHGHSFLGFPAEAADGIRRLAQALGARLELNVHDYEMICPRVNLVDENGLYCGEPDVAGCNRCLSTRGAEFPATDIGQWRNRYQMALRAADRIFVPDGDVATRLTRYFPGISPQVAPHEEVHPAWGPPVDPQLQSGQSLRIVVIGAISIFKGYDILLKCATAAKREKLPLEFVLMGYSRDDLTLQKGGVKVTGRYEESDALQTLQGLEPGIVWLPSTWPETYSYTLSVALTAGCPVFAFELGAIAGRLRALDRGEYLLPLAAMGDPEFVNAQFIAYRERVLQATEQRISGAARTVDSAGAVGGRQKGTAGAKFDRLKRREVDVPSYWSRFGGLWTDRRDAAQVLADKAKKDPLVARWQPQLAQFIDNGYVILERVISPAVADAYLESLYRARQHGSGLLASVPVLEQRDKDVVPLDRADLAAPLTKVLDTYSHVQEAHPIIFAEAIRTFLCLIFEDDILAFQGLHFEKGSIQAVHQDTAYVVGDEPLKFAASWVALEDVRAGSGELIYYPGSHRLADWLYSGQYKHYNHGRDPHEQHLQHLQSLHDRSRAAGYPLQSFLPKKCDALIWAADLAHGGLQITDPSLTRRSLVTHYMPLSCTPSYFKYLPREKQVTQPSVGSCHTSTFYY